MSCRNQFYKIAPVSKMRVYIQEILNSVAVISDIQVATLLENGAEPDCRYPKSFQVVKLGTDTFERPSLPAIVS